ncbi:MAG TPA: porin [Thermoanaerobaculia bacterium]
MQLKTIWILIVVALVTGPAGAYESREPVPADVPPSLTGESQKPDPQPTQEGISGEKIAEKVKSLGEDVSTLRKNLEVLRRMRLSGYIQPQFVDDQSSSDELTGTSTRNRDQFSVRRARVKFTYQVLPTSRFVVQPDITSSGVSLKDGYLELTEPWTSWKHTLTAGQFTWPFGFELLQSSNAREMPERSRAVQTLFPGVRDRGVMLSGLGLQDRFRYQVAIVNGTGTTQSFDANSRKDFVGRASWSFGQLNAGASIYRGHELVATDLNPRGVEFDKEREGIDLQWKTPVNGLALRGEYITGRQAPSSGSSLATSRDVAGWYLYAVQNIGTRHQLILRTDQYDPDTDVARNATRTLGGSYIFHWDANSKVMFAYEAPRNQINDPDDDVLTIRYQFSF